MKERPILFSAPMVRAILENRKTMTRRTVKENPLDGPIDAIFPDGSGKGFISWWGPGPHTAEKTIQLYPGEEGFHCPYGRPGDRLWVRESYRFTVFNDPLKPSLVPVGSTVEYAADNFSLVMGKTRQSIFMPRWASRITLEITSIRVERLQDISEDDAESEGVDPWSSNALDFGSYFNSFSTLWDSINGKTPGKAWADNPWVWVVEFRRINNEEVV